MGPGRGPLVYAIASGLQSRLKLSLDVLLAIGKLLFIRQAKSGMYSDTHLHTDKCLDSQTDRQFACFARHERDKGMTMADEMHAHLWLC